MNKNKIVNLSGITENRIAPVAADIIRDKKSQCLIIVSSENRAKRLAVDLSFFAGKKIHVMPQEDNAFLRYEAKNKDMLFERIRILKALACDEDCVVIAPAAAAIKKNPPADVLVSNSVNISIRNNIDIEWLKAALARIGYERSALIEARGEFSARGDIVDVFPPDSDNPYRIEFFDDEVDSIREFDADTQRSVQNVERLAIYPASLIINTGKTFKKAADRISKEYDDYIRMLDKPGNPEELNFRIEQIKSNRSCLFESLSHSANIQYMENYINYFYDAPEYIWDYMRSGDIFIDDPDRINEYLDARDKESIHDFEANLARGLAIPKDFESYSGKDGFSKVYEKDNVYICTPFAKTFDIPGRVIEARHIDCRQTAVFNGRMDGFGAELARYVNEGFSVTVVCSTKERKANIEEFLERHELRGKVEVTTGNLTGGVELTSEKRCYFCDGDIFTAHKYSSSRRKKKPNKQVLQSFSDMQKGDYVVHENHGIGKFLGIEQLTVQNVKKDYLMIKYAGEDKLYVPVEQMDIVQKYVGSDSAAPKINRLSSGEWKKAKANAKAAIANMAKELLELSARRKLVKGFAFSADTVWQKEFEDGFFYQETEDQERCIQEIKSDMESEYKMERLLCGDVGFGKTEVAARAVFKCADNGKQAAVLVPTTILANQHYYTLKERFAPFPISVEMLSRFKTDKQQEDIVKKLAAGSIDVVIGTHRLLSSDVGFKDLGLLVVDEEQRFGVMHKEKIKKLKENVDILMLSATPIPRTLHMSLAGIRDMSLIEDPPEDRYPVQTYVLEQEDGLMKNAIERELARGGQVYIVYNRVSGIYRIAEKIKSLVPDANVSVGHGRMNERALEDVMLEFIGGSVNVLVSTTIIESGIDIPNVNTIIILDSDKFGLSQLYQLRGRVGRSNRLAYAYLMYQKSKVLTETAEKRLRAIKEFTEFGSGFKVAMKDLEIRGAGNLLGTEQHGHMMMIGYELYCKLIDDAVRALSGEIVNPDREACSVELEASAFIPEKYISDEVQKLQMYKKIASIASREDELSIIGELSDRFGDAPKEALNLIKIAKIRAMAESAGVMRIFEQPGKVVFSFAAGNILTADILARLAEKYGPRVFLHLGAKPFIRLSYDKETGKIGAAEELLEKIGDFR